MLLIHGGPGLSSSRDFVWEAWPLAQMIASRGYVVLQPNYRGSDNLGNAYMTAIVRNTVAGPSADILAGLDALARSAEVDASRVAVSGWSYGGELTSWLIGHDHRWRAAVSGAAVNSEFEEYNLSTSNVQDRYPLGTSPYTDDGVAHLLASNSPITYYRQITTPTLIWGTTLDPVVPITQSYALFHALDRQPRSRTLRRLSRLDTRSGRSATDGRPHAPVARLARRAPALMQAARLIHLPAHERYRAYEALYAAVLFLRSGCSPPAAAPAEPPPAQRVVLRGRMLLGHAAGLRIAARRRPRRGRLLPEATPTPRTTRRSAPARPDTRNRSKSPTIPPDFV